MDHGDSRPTEEICGALLGHRQNKTWVITDYRHLTNTSPNKSMHYIPDPNEWIKILKKTTFLDKKAKLDLIGIFHTHPMSQPVASITDIEEAGYEGVYWIYSPKFKNNNFYYYDGDEEKRQFNEITYKVEDFLEWKKRNY